MAEGAREKFGPEEIIIGLTDDVVEFNENAACGDDAEVGCGENCCG